MCVCVCVCVCVHIRQERSVRKSNCYGLLRMKFYPAKRKSRWYKMEKKSVDILIHLIIVLFIPYCLNFGHNLFKC